MRGVEKRRRKKEIPIQRSKKGKEERNKRIERLMANKSLLAFQMTNGFHEIESFSAKWHAKPKAGMETTTQCHCEVKLTDDGACRALNSTKFWRQKRYRVT